MSLLPHPSLLSPSLPSSSLHSFFSLSPSLLPQVWINQGDIILVGLRDYQDNKADVILRYNPDEARNLKSYGELPDTGGCGHERGVVIT